MLQERCSSYKTVEAAVNLVLDVGRPSFSDAYAQYLRQYANVRQFIVAAFTRERGLSPTLLMTSNKKIYTFFKSFYFEYDPNLNLIFDYEYESRIFFLPNLMDAHYSATYRQSIFQSVGVIDKFVAAYWLNGVCYYTNYYRLEGEEPFSPADRAELIEVSNLISHLIVRHFDNLGPSRAVAAQQSDNKLEHLVRQISSQTPLTNREVQVCALILLGCSSEAIALRLGIALSSVVTYRRRAYGRLGIVSQNELFARVLAHSETQDLAYSLAS